MKPAAKLIAIAFTAGAVTATAGFTAYHQASQVHSNKALEAEQSAANHLKEANTGKTPHLTAAQTHVSEAMKETKAAIAAGEEK